MRDGQIEAWAITLAVEGLAAALIGPAFGVARWRAAVAAVAGSLMTHPVIWWLFFELDGFRYYWRTVAIVEAVAVFGEAPVYRLAGTGWTRAVLLSLCVNAASVLAGYLRHWLI